MFRFPRATRRDPEVEAWLNLDDPLRRIAKAWFERLRACGDDIREIMHDGRATACSDDAAFGYVAAFRSHVNLGFFFGAALDDPARLLLGSGKRMRHVKLLPERRPDNAALERLIAAAYHDIRLRLTGEEGSQIARDV